MRFLTPWEAELHLLKWYPWTTTGRVQRFINDKLQDSYRVDLN